MPLPNSMAVVAAFLLLCIPFTATVAEGGGDPSPQDVSPVLSDKAEQQRRPEEAADSSSGSNDGPCPLCNAAQCNVTMCDLAAPFACIVGAAAGGCSSSASTWANPSSCTTCCSVVGCEISCPSCGPLICNTKPLPCSSAAPYLCMAGARAGSCGQNTTWSDTSQCDACCDLESCFATTAPGLPPAQSCLACPKHMCTNPPCGRSDPYYCFTNDGCGINTTWTNNPGCSSCCSLEECYPPRPPSPWDVVPNTTNCSYTSAPYLTPSPLATPYGGMDVSNFGCKASVSDSCCGFTPRFNWVLSTCHTDPKKRVSMACTHNGSQFSALDLYYVSAYQYNGTHWVKDPTSSMTRKRGEKFVNLTDRFLGGGYRQDWDLKYGPTTHNSGTAGLGPPGMLFVISAAKFSWSAFYALNQITINRGPGGEVVAVNCWGDSSGELDFIESPFWADVKIPMDRLYLTVTADAGRCFPVQKNIPSSFRHSCTSKYCCEMCSCPNGTVCFGSTDDIGFEAMGCIPAVNMSQIPNGSTIFEVNRDPLACGKYFGGVSGGATSDAYFTQHDEEGNGEAVYAALIDKSGVRVFRWPTSALQSDDEMESEELQTDAQTNAASDDGKGKAGGGQEREEAQYVDPWPGIFKFYSDSVLPQKQPTMGLFHQRPPCTNWSAPCMLYEPSCSGDCPLISAAGNFGPDELAGGYSAEAARDGLNWWDLFDNIVDDPTLQVADLPRWLDVPTFIPPLPFYCNASCGTKTCESLSRCPIRLPYMCTKGDGVNGCTNVSSFWPLSQHCSDCCDVRLCEKPCTACSPEVCEARTCSPDNPFVCTEGPEKNGCSNASRWWPEQAACWKCCDINTCPPPTSAPVPTTTLGPAGDIRSGNDEVQHSSAEGEERVFLPPSRVTLMITRGASSESIASLGVAVAAVAVLWALLRYRRRSYHQKPI